jgi:hypothetical protein
MHLLKKLSAIFFIATASITYSYGQAGTTGTIRGFVYDKANGEPVIFTNVLLKGTKYGGPTDVNGYYNISKLAPGTYTVMVAALGYDTLKAIVSVKADDIITKKLYLSARTVELTGVEISAQKKEAQTSVRIGVNKVTPKEIKQVASVGGEADIAQYLQVLPGVISSGDQGGQLYIRGGEPIQNKVLLDGMTIYNPFHSIGLFSVFDADIIRNADVYTAGFNAEYGGRISSIMDIRTRDGNKKQFGGKVSVSPFMSKLILEGPLIKQTDDEKGSASFIFSGKTSYLQQTSKAFYSYVDKNASIPIPYNFTDLYGKVSLNAGNGSKLNLFGFNFSDDVNYKGISDYNWTSAGGGANFVIIPGSSPVLIDGTVAYSNYQTSFKEDAINSKPKTSGISGFNMGLNFTYFLADDELKYGIDMQAYSTNFKFYTQLNNPVELDGTTTEVVGFAKYKINFKKKLIIEPGLHVHYYAKLDEFSFEPRFGAKYIVNNNFRLKMAAGLYSQNFISATSNRDVVNLFYGFLTGPDNVAPYYGQNDVTSKLQKARHLVAGFEYDLPFNLELNVEGYVKDFYQLTAINSNKLYPSDYDFVIEKGLAKGVDFVLKYDVKRLYIWLTYSLGQVTRTGAGNTGDLTTYPTNYDRRNNLSLVTSYSFGKGGNWEADARWNYGTGFPFTPTQGFANTQNFNGGIGTNTNNSNSATPTILYGDINSARLTNYHRFDLTIKRKFSLGKNSILETNFSVTNLYNRSNIFYIERTTNAKIYQLPILPSIGANLTF